MFRADRGIYAANKVIALTHGRQMSVLNQASTSALVPVAAQATESTVWFRTKTQSVGWHRHCR